MKRFSSSAQRELTLFLKFQLRQKNSALWMLLSGWGGWAGTEKRVMLSALEMKDDRLTHHKHNVCKVPAAVGNGGQHIADC